jgi:hypothetical protein
MRIRNLIDPGSGMEKFRIRGNHPDHNTGKIDKLQRPTFVEHTPVLAKKRGGNTLLYLLYRGYASELKTWIKILLV